MDVVKQICLRDEVLEDDIGNRLVLERGKEYITSRPKPGDKKITVFSSYWVKVSRSWFGGPKEL